jgi:hypothetical protein
LNVQCCWRSFYRILPLSRSVLSSAHRVGSQLSRNLSREIVTFMQHFAAHWWLL